MPDAYPLRHDPSAQRTRVPGPADDPRVASWLGSLTPVEAPSSLGARVLASLPERLATSRAARHGSPLSWVPAAAALVLIAVGVGVVSGSGSASPRPESACVVPARPFAVVDDPTLAPLDPAEVFEGDRAP